MKIKELLNEVNDDTTTTKEKGTYAGLKIRPQDEEAIFHLTKKMDLPSPIKKEDIHLTLLFSRKYLPDYQPLKTVNYEAKPTRFEIFGQEQKILVLKLESNELVKRHKELMKEHDATYDFDEYIPHITLSYDLGNEYLGGDMENDVLLDKISEEFLKEIPDRISIIKEYKEDLDLNWKENK